MRVAHNTRALHLSLLLLLPLLLLSSSFVSLSD
jgi:hypothetical protein